MFVLLSNYLLKYLIQELGSESFIRWLVGLWILLWMHRGCICGRASRHWLLDVSTDTVWSYVQCPLFNDLNASVDTGHWTHSNMGLGTHPSTPRMPLTCEPYDICGHYVSLGCVHRHWALAVADLGGARDASPALDQIFLIFMQFSGKLVKW